MPLIAAHADAQTLLRIERVGRRQPEDHQRLSPYVFCAHVNHAAQSKQRANCCRRDAVLACARFRDHTLFSHAPRQQCLAQGVIDLMRASVQKIFAFQVNLRSASVRSQPSRMKQRRRSAGVIAQQLIEFAPEIVVLARARKLFSQLLQRRDQDFRNIATAKPPPMSVFVWLTSDDL